MTYPHAKVQGQRSIGSKTEWKQTDGQTDGGDCITSHANAVGKHTRSNMAKSFAIKSDQHVLVMEQKQYLNALINFNGLCPRGSRD